MQKHRWQRPARDTLENTPGLRYEDRKSDLFLHRFVELKELL